MSSFTGGHSKLPADEEEEQEQRQRERDEGEIATLPATACLRCRKQKLRCSRDLPTCKRCRDVATVCSYPPPPDRKALAAHRLQNAKARARRDLEGSTGLRGLSRLFVNTEITTQETSSYSMNQTNDEIQYKSQAEDSRMPPPPLQAVLKRTTLPSSEIASFLFDIFFQRSFHASLLFHKDSLLFEYAANRVPDFVALSIFAVASIFLRQPSKVYRGGNDEDGVDSGFSLFSGSDFEQQGHEWATAASQRVLMQADVPRLETVQACQNLGMYWFSRGQTDKTHVHTHTAYRTARLLNLHMKQPKGGSIHSYSWAEELKRRCYWSCWITSCISEDNAYFKSKPWKDVVGLMLPSDDNSYAAGTPISTGSFDKDGNIKLSVNVSIKSPPSRLAEHMKIYDLWWQVQHFAKHYQDPSSGKTSNFIAELHELDRRLGLIAENLHPDFQYHSASSFLISKEATYQIFEQQTMYRVCVCVLHASVVPLFSDTPSSPLVSKRMERVSAEESVKNAEMMLEMANAFTRAGVDASPLSIPIAHAMFVCTTVHLKSLVAQRKLQAYGTSHFKGAVAILEQLKGYWNGIDILWTSLTSLFASQGINIDTISTSDNGQCLDRQDHPNLEDLIAHDVIRKKSATTETHNSVMCEKNLSRHFSDNRSQIRRSSSQNAPSPRSIKRQRSDPAEQAKPISPTTDDSKLLKKNSNVRTCTLPYQQLPSHQTHIQPFAQIASHALQQPFDAVNSQIYQQEHRALGGYTPLETLPIVGPSHVPNAMDPRYRNGDGKWKFLFETFSSG